MEILSKLKEPLKIEDVDFRIQSISPKGYATILAYKDARVDMNRLDDVCGANWQKDFKTIEGRLYCGVAIKVNDEWLWRWDVGTESFADKEKGQASDAFKRACFNWGIGRELYNYPHIRVKLFPNEFAVENNKAKPTYNLNLKDWVWAIEVSNDGTVQTLLAKDKNGNVRYAYPELQRNTVTQVPNTPAVKKELKKMDGKQMTKEWLAIVKRITARSLTSLDVIEDHYIISAELYTELSNLLNSVTNGQK